jgi:hypothetical protein
VTWAGDGDGGIQTRYAGTDDDDLRNTPPPSLSSPFPYVSVLLLDEPAL